MEPWLAHALHLWWTSLLRESERYVTFAVLTWAVLWVALRVPLRGRKIRSSSPPALQLAIEFLVSMRSIAVFAGATALMVVLSDAGGYPLSDVADRLGPMWIWASLALMIVGHDAYFYWSHRAMHHPKLLAKFHRRHHRSFNPSPFTAYSFDLREAVVMVSFVVLWPFLVPTPWAVIPLFVGHQIVRNTLAHCGYELMPARADGRPLFDWLTTTTHHDLHHANAGSNFGLYFTWWDRWMGTENPAYHETFARAARPRLAATRLELSEA
jgi:sterol desaturase/sphingolipid hydroxylase (fatty acid hydroxylase superfamily)